MAVIPYPEWRLWMYYANVFGAMSPNGMLLDSDGAVALAFGRNSIPDCDLSSVRSLDQVRGESYLATIKRLSDQGFDPGTPNQKIAETIKGYLSMYRIVNASVFAQWELCVALFQMYGEQWITRTFSEQRLSCLWPRPNMENYRSLHVLDDAYKADRKRQRPMNYPLLLAHDFHMPRVYMLARKIWDCPIVVRKTITQSFDPKSVQKMTTTPLQWYSYEAHARVHHLLHHWV